MRIRVLGSGAGGGFPQWNCGCPGCRAVREGTRPATPRTQSSIAVSGDGARWYLVNASPDVRAQIDAFPALHPGPDRATPIAAVLLTDAEIDHTLGLLLLREGRGVEVHASRATHETLREGTGFLPTLERYCPVDWRPVEPGASVALDEHLSYRAFDVPTAKKARFSSGAPDDVGRVLGYRFTDTATGAAAVYLPGVQELAPAVRAELDGVDTLLVDGTCWEDDELIALGLGVKTAHEMGHMAIGGAGGSLEQLAALPIRRKAYIHINNTNPILLEDSPQRRTVCERGMDVTYDGWEAVL